MTNFSPSDEQWESRVRESFAAQAAMDTFGIQIAALWPGRVEFRFSPPPGLTQQDGYLHAGVVAAALDSACGYAAYSLAPAGSRVLTSEYKINLLRPADAADYTAAGWVVKRGKTLTVSQAELRADADSVVAIMTGTIIVVGDSGP